MIFNKYLVLIIKTNNIEDFFLIKREWLSDNEIEVYNFVYDYINTTKKLPPIAELQERFFISDFDGDFDYYKKQFYKYISEKLFNNLIAKLHLTVKENSLSNSLDNIRKFLNEIEDVYSDRITYDLKTGLNKFLTESFLRKDLSDKGLPTPYSNLNDAIIGYRKGVLYVVVARPDVGKTQFLLLNANHIYKLGKKVLFVSMEMQAEHIYARLLALWTGADAYKFYAKEISLFAYEQLKQKIENLTGTFDILDGRLNTNLAIIASKLEQNQYDILFIDAAYLIKDNNTFRNRWEQVEYVITEIQKLALRYNIPIVCSYQLNRTDGMKKRGGVEGIQLSDAIGQLAGVVIKLNKHEDKEFEREVQIIKNKGKVGGRFIINWNFDYNDFTEQNPIIEMGDDYV